jgi:hypothetical protein
VLRAARTHLAVSGTSLVGKEKQGNTLLCSENAGHILKRGPRPLEELTAAEASALQCGSRLLDFDALSEAATDYQKDLHKDASAPRVRLRLS